MRKDNYKFYDFISEVFITLIDRINEIKEIQHLKNHAEVMEKVVGETLEEIEQYLNKLFKY